MNFAALGVRYVAVNLMIDAVAGALGAFADDQGVCVLVGAGKGRKLLDHQGAERAPGLGSVRPGVCGVDVRFGGWWAALSWRNRWRVPGVVNR